MENDTSVKQSVYRMLRKYNISKPTLDNLIFLINSYDFDIIDFDPNESTGTIYTLIENLQLESMISSCNAFTYQNSDVKLVFVNETLAAEEKKCVLAHELGHIALGHLKNGYNGNSNIAEEYEANEFAHYLLRPNFLFRCEQKVMRYKKISLIVAIAIIVLISSVFIACHFVINNSYYGDYYVTESGEKYHEKDCIFIKNRENVHRMTKEEFESGEYEPCKTCLP